MEKPAPKSKAGSCFRRCMSPTGCLSTGEESCRVPDLGGHREAQARQKRQPRPVSGQRRLPGGGVSGAQSIRGARAGAAGAGPSVPRGGGGCQRLPGRQWRPQVGVPAVTAPVRSAAVRLRHHLRGRVPARAALRAAQQLGGGPPGRAQVRLPAPAPGGRARAGHRHLVPHPGGHRAPGGRQQRERAGGRGGAGAGAAQTGSR